MLYDENRQLLKECSKSWDNIKDREFFIINGQHRITTTKELQEGGVCEKRQIEL